MRKFYEKLPIVIQGVIFGLLITAAILLSTPPIVMFLRWWFRVWACNQSQNESSGSSGLR